MTSVVTIDCFPSSLERYRDDWAVIGVDVIRATTTAVTAVATGRRCFPVPTVQQAWEVAATLVSPLLAGEQNGTKPAGFEENNSPAALALRTDTERPVVLLSTAGTRLIHEVGPRKAVYAACLRNISATVAHVARHHHRVAVIGAGTHGEFREEDQLGCAWLTAGLLAAGFETDDRTREIVARWEGSSVATITTSHSADYLRRSHQLADLRFVLDHVDDIDAVFAVSGQELVQVDELDRLVVASSMSASTGATA